MILFQCLQWTVACNLVEQEVMSPCVREGVVVGEIMGTCKTAETSVLDTNKNQTIITIPSKGMIIIGAPITTGKMAEGVEEGDFPEEEVALEEGAEEDASLILFIPTNNKTLSEKEVETARQQLPQMKLLLYPNRHLWQVISQVVEEVLEVVVEDVAVEGLLMEEEAGQVEQRWRKCYQPKLGRDLVQWMKVCLLLDKQA
mmetsp:Transcript_25562/g.36461  ORF Transcript_25562/g.36461 Transcript_25562/m.36461 type:complete len:200 (-) Transcript_25562:39-638(-)